MSKIELRLGDTVRDKVSGFKGIAIARYSYLQGCDRFCLQPPVDKDGKLPDTANFDEPQLEVMSKQTVKKTADKSNQGGPDKYSDSRSY